MKKVLIGLVLSILLLVINTLYYLHSQSRIEYEHSIQLPSSAKILKVESEWWIPRWSNRGRENKCWLRMGRTELAKWIATLENCPKCTNENIEVGQHYVSLPIRFGDFREILVLGEKGDDWVIRVRTVFND